MITTPSKDIEYQRQLQKVLYYEKFLHLSNNRITKKIIKEIAEEIQRIQIT